VVADSRIASYATTSFARHAEIPAKPSLPVPIVVPRRKGLLAGFRVRSVGARRRTRAPISVSALGYVEAARHSKVHKRVVALQGESVPLGIDERRQSRELLERP